MNQTMKKDQNKKKLKPFIRIGPGHIIKRNLEALGWSQKDLSAIIGLEENIISELIHHKRRITIDLARKLASAFDSSPEFWLNLEMKYQLGADVKESENKKLKATGVKAKIRRHMPVADMAKLGWLKKTLSVEGLTKLYYDFWNVDKLDFSFYEKEVGFLARKSNNDLEFTKNYSITWLQMARKCTSTLPEKGKKYDGNKVLDLAESIGQYSIQPEGVSEFISDLYDAGIHFFKLSHLPKTYLDGAAFQFNNERYIVYTNRHDRVDNFWFTMAHELAHHIKHIHSNTDCFLDNLDEEAGNQKEKEADSLASKWLKTAEILKLAQPYSRYLSEKRLTEICEQVGIEKSVVLGILQYHKLVDYRRLSQKKAKVSPLIPKEYVRG